MSSRILALLVGLFFTTQAPAQSTWYVPDDHPTIQGALSAVSGGDRVIVRPGVYIEDIDFLGKSIYLTSQRGPSVTTIQGTGLKSVVTAENGEQSSTILEGFTITGGNAQDSGGALRCIGASPTIVKCDFVGNTAQNRGGAVFSEGGQPNFTSCSFVRNTALGTGGGAVHLSFVSNITFQSCDFRENEVATSSIGAGGAIYAASSGFGSLSILKCNFDSNTANERGGALRTWAIDNVLINQCSFTNNLSGYGGACAFAACQEILLNKSVFRFNEATLPLFSTTTNSGGAVFIEVSNASIHKCIFTNNTAAESGGGAYSRWTDNYDYEITNCTFTDNSAQNGGGIANEGGSPLFSSCIVWGNSAAVGENIYEADPANQATVEYSLIGGGWPGTANVDQDPLFMSPPANIKLQSTSPCIDGGDPTFRFDRDGTRADMGARQFDQRQPFTLSISNLAEGSAANIQVSGAAPGRNVLIAFSLSGGGPVNSPWGDLLLTPPYFIIPGAISANLWGEGNKSRYLGANTTGTRVWIQAYDVGWNRLSNGLALTVQ